jgi:hypothetical protein
VHKDRIKVILNGRLEILCWGESIVPLCAYAKAIERCDYLKVHAKLDDCAIIARPDESSKRNVTKAQRKPRLL